MFNNFVYFENSMIGVDTERVVRFSMGTGTLRFFLENDDVVEIINLDDIENFKRNILKLDERK